MYGPLEYVVVQFEGNRSSGDILPQLMAIQQQDGAGELTVLEISDHEEAEASAYEPLISEFHGLLTEADLATAAVELPQNTSAAVALFEHRWAVGLQSAVRAAGGQALASGFIHPETQAEVIAELEEGDGNSE